jgi:MOSC domain-containing protein YiiM
MTSTAGDGGPSAPLPSFADLEAAWRVSPPPPRDRGIVRLLVRRVGGGMHETPDEVLVTPEQGMEGDRWARSGSPKPDRHLTLMNVRAAELVTSGRQPLHVPGDNLLVDFDLSVAALPPGTRLCVGEVILEVSTAPHTGCGKFAARVGEEALRWTNAPEHAARRLRGINCQVVEPGRIRVGAAVCVVR